MNKLKWQFPPLTAWLCWITCVSTLKHTHTHTSKIWNYVKPSTCKVTSHYFHSQEQTQSCCRWRNRMGISLNINEAHIPHYARHMHGSRDWFTAFLWRKKEVTNKYGSLLAETEVWLMWARHEGSERQLKEKRVDHLSPRRDTFQSLHPSVCNSNTEYVPSSLH